VTCLTLALKDTWWRKIGTPPRLPEEDSDGTSARWHDFMYCVYCKKIMKLGTPWWWPLEAETYVGAIDSVYENAVHMLVLILWFVITMHGEYNVKNMKMGFKKGITCYETLCIRQVFYIFYIFQENYENSF
jgi:hypothetical protein